MRKIKNTGKALAAVLLCFCALPWSLLLGGCSGKAPSFAPGEIVHAKITLADERTITLELYPDIAPKTVSNFVKLCNEQFYDGLLIYRVVPNFLIQTGDPTGKGYYGSEQTIEGEFSANGYNGNTLHHERGTVSMARKPNGYNTASSQFFICLEQCKKLDGEYAAFGKVTDGFDVLDSIAAVQTDDADRPVEDIVIRSVRIVK